jgi:hypothetical protein
MRQGIFRKQKRPLPTLGKGLARHGYHYLKHANKADG